MAEPAPSRVADCRERVRDLDLAELSRALRARELSSVDVTSAYLDQIAELDDAVGAWVRTYPERALRAAEQADRGRAVTAGERAAADLAGVPIGLKDVIAVAGEPLSLGSAAFAADVAAADATAWARLRRRGAVLLGHNTTQELAIGNAPQLVANPWDLGRSPGGTSNGSAAAVAAGMVPVSLGTDVGGSLRRPASACGLSTFIATAGAVSLGGVHTFNPAAERVGPLARSAADCATVSAALASPGPRLGRPAPVSVDGARLGRVELRGEQCPDPEVAAVLARFERELGELGADVVAVEQPASPTLDPRPRPALVEFLRAHLATRGARLSPYVRGLGRELLARAERDGVADEESDRLALDRYRQAWGGVFAGLGLDAVFLPAQLAVTPALETVRDCGDLDRFGDAAIRAMWNQLGAPVACIPAGRTADGMPVGIQLAGAWWEDELVLGLAIAFQAATDHHRFRTLPAAADRALVGSAGTGST
ncbi:MAG: amidase [Solirubrobacterales bacterium]